MSGVGVFCLGRYLLYWLDAVERFKRIQAKVGIRWERKMQKHPSQLGKSWRLKMNQADWETMEMEESKTSKPGNWHQSKGSKLIGKQVGDGWFKMIQARGENHFKRIQAKTLPYTITYNQKNAKNGLLKLLPEVLVGFASGFNRCRVLFNEPRQEPGTINLGCQPSRVTFCIRLTCFFVGVATSDLVDVDSRSGETDGL